MNNHKLILLLIVVVGALRLLPHPGNFTPIGAFALFSGAYVTDRRFMALPLVALLIGDVIAGGYAVIVMVAVYLGFAASALVGRVLLAGKRSPLRFIGGVLLGALAFYLISNVGMWLWADTYPKTLSGLIGWWIDGWPFLLRSVAADFIYGSIIFGIVEVHRQRLIQGRYAG